MLFLLCVMAACTQESVRTDVSIEREPVFRVLFEPRASNRILGQELYTVRNLDQFPEFHNVHIREGFNMAWAHRNGLTLEAKDLHPLLVNAQPIAPDDPIFDAWHYISWQSVGFESAGRQWNVGLYLGGLGFIQNDEGQSGAFKYEMPKTESE